MTQVVVLKQEDKVEEIFSDPNDLRLFDHDLHLQAKIKGHLYESQSTTIDLSNNSTWNKNWDVLQVPVTDNSKAPVTESSTTSRLRRSGRDARDPGVAVREQG